MEAAEVQETFEEAQVRLAEQIEDGHAMKRLLENADFQRLFEKKYIEAFAITNAYNFAKYDEKTRDRLNEKLAARSIFSMFVQDTIGYGNLAVEELKEAKEAEQENQDGEE